MTSPLPDDAEIFVPVKDLRDLFDIVCCSMDFGSGFLDAEQVDTVRRVAVLLGVDPMEATPSSQATSYPHPFVVAQYGSLCRHCRKAEIHGCHVPEVAA